MNLIPRDSWFDFDRLFNQFLPATNGKQLAEGFFSPRIDITERDNDYRITAELAGVKKDDLHVTLEDGVLTIQASVNTEKSDEKEGKVIRRERMSGSYLRSFNVGTGITEGDINAKFEDGLLELTVPKAKEPEPTKKRVDIK